jgi:hypothetical protein
MDGWEAQADGVRAINGGQAQVAIDPAGNAMAVWAQYDANYEVFDILANRSTPATGFGDAIKIEYIHSGHAQEPHVAMDSDGNSLVVSLARTNALSARRSTRHNI